MWTIEAIEVDYTGRGLGSGVQYAGCSMQNAGCRMHRERSRLWLRGRPCILYPGGGRPQAPVLIAARLACEFRVVSQSQQQFPAA